DYFAINTDPAIPIVAPAGGSGLARSASDLEALAPVLNREDRQHLHLGAGDSPASLAGKTVKASDALHLSTRTLAALGYNVDPTESTATELTDGDFLRLGIRVTELPI